MRDLRTSSSRFLAGCVLFTLLALPGATAANGAAVGLSGVGGQRFGNEDLLFYVPQTDDQFGAALAVGDFNGDGADDLATGIPLDDGIVGFELVDSGSVVVRYGISGVGLDNGLASTFLRETTPVDPPDEDDRYGSALAACDFNGDGFDDLAIGIPGEDHLGFLDAGAVQVHYGSAAGIHTAGDLFFTESTVGVPGEVECCDLFGKVLACGDFDADGYADLAIGVPDETFTGPGFHVREGIVIVSPGSASGVDPLHSRELDQDGPGMAGEAEPLDNFGSAFGVGDFNGDGFDDLAIGVPGDSYAEAFQGSVQMVFGGLSGLTAAGNFVVTEEFIGGTPAEEDGFGSALASGDFDGDGFDDLAIGTPLKDLTGGFAPASGTVCEVFGAPGGLDPTRGDEFDENRIFGLGATEAGDLFGWALAAGDFDHDGFADLTIGAPGEITFFHPADGAATLLMGTPAQGLWVARHLSIAAGLNGIPGVALQSNRNFAQALAAGDFNGDGHADLALGAPLEDEAGLADVGAEVVLYGSLFADGFETGDFFLWSLVSP